MALTKKDYQAKIAAEAANYPVAAQLYQARDPRFLAQLDAMAAMLALRGAEQEVVAAEPFTFARDVTVLAEAAIKGILPFGRSTRVGVQLQNTSTSPIVVTAGRRLLDTQGRVYVVDVGATVAGGAVGMVIAEQRVESSFTHVVTESVPFYKIAIPSLEEGFYIASIAVADTAGGFEYKPDFINTAVGDRAYNIESDERRQLFVRFGAAEITGVQPAIGDEITINLVLTEGEITLNVGSPFAFEYSTSLFDAGAIMTLGTIETAGSAPMDIATMREIIRFPSVYDDSAVFLGNFDFLVRRRLSPFVFLSVWNEQVEENARGVNVDNINTLFYAAEKAGVTDPDLADQIETVLRDADNSYRFKRVPVNRVEIPMTLTLTASPIYDFAAITQQAIDLIIAQYGEASPFAKRGRNRILKKLVSDLLYNNIQALSDAVSDIEITISDPVVDMKPEDFRYVSPASLTVIMEQAT